MRAPDTLIGGPGNDVLEAGENYNYPDDCHDTLISNGCSDVLYADPGADSLSAAPATICSSPRPALPGRHLQRRPR